MPIQYADGSNSSAGRIVQVKQSVKTDEFKGK